MIWCNVGAVALLMCAHGGRGAAVHTHVGADSEVRCMILCGVSAVACWRAHVERAEAVHTRGSSQ
jgi:hypothetical protein